MVINDVDLSVNLNGLILKNPVITASGTFGYCDEYKEFFEVNKLGAIVTKAITIEPRPGNKGLRLFEVNQGMINSIGLENMGIKAFLAKVLPRLKEQKIDFIMNLAGATKEEYIELAKICETNHIKAVELNLSCPNVKSGCLEFGTDEKVMYELVNEIRNLYNGHLTVKLTPNVTSIEKMAVAAQKAGANAVSAINTVKATGLKLEFINGKFCKKQLTGGMSGSAIKPVALRAVKVIRENIDIPIIGMGGITSLQDMLEFIAVGADAVQIGTANFTNPTISKDIVEKLQNFIIENDFGSFENLKKKIREDIQ